jgi:hypothetical protein
MSSDFPTSSAALDAAIRNATSPEQIREIAKSAMIAAGVISRERGFESDVVVHRMPEMAAPESSLPADEYPFTKYIRWAESTGRQPVTIRAKTLKRLQEIENQLLYGHQ